MDSHQYRALFMRLTKNRGWKMMEYVYFYMLVNQVKSLDRLTDTRGMAKPEFKAKYGKEDWYTKIMEFLKKDCVMYVAEVKKKTGMSGKFPIVNTNTAWPTMAFVAFAYRLAGSKNVSAMSETDILEAFLEEKNTWVVQMYLDPAMQARAKVANQNFWEKVVTKSNNTISGAYEGTVGSDRGKFSEVYYKTQSNDEYPFATMQGGRIQVTPGMKSETDIVSLIRMFASA
jgi:hypothetical protein